MEREGVKREGRRKNDGWTDVCFKKEEKTERWRDVRKGKER